MNANTPSPTPTPKTSRLPSRRRLALGLFIMASLIVIIVLAINDPPFTQQKHDSSSDEKNMLVRIPNTTTAQISHATESGQLISPPLPAPSPTPVEENTPLSVYTGVKGQAVPSTVNPPQASKEAQYISGYSPAIVSNGAMVGSGDSLSIRSGGGSVTAHSPNRGLESRSHTYSYVADGRDKSRRDGFLKNEGFRRITPVTTDNEDYGVLNDNDFLEVVQNPLSTFSIDVDTASYSNIRRFLSEGNLPPRDSVRIEEMINYFSYDYQAPRGKEPFAVNMEMAQCPWNARHNLVRIGLKGREVSDSQRPPLNLVFLVDVSGSMQPENKLPLVKQSLRLLVDRLQARDRVALVVYAGNSGVVLESTPVKQRARILKAIDSLESGGSTNGGQGIRLAYSIAGENFIEGGVNRVVLATDGDFNVGITDRNELVSLISEKARTGVFLTVLGYGMGNLKDQTLEQLADKGNGNYAYIDSLQEARRVLVRKLGGTLYTIAKDVKIQIEFNPSRVAAYRLIGYENRLLRDQDFNNDRIDAGDIGAGHTVTALYEIVPTEVGISQPGVDPLKYQVPSRRRAPVITDSPEMLTLKLRYKEPTQETSRLLEFTATDLHIPFSRASRDFKFAASVAAFGMILRESPHRGQADLNQVLQWAEEGMTRDRDGARSEFTNLVRQASRTGRDMSLGYQD